jgi:hypothetical protein
MTSVMNAVVCCLLLLLVQWLCTIEAAGVASPAQLQHQQGNASHGQLHPAQINSNVAAAGSPAIAAARCRLVLRGHYADHPAAANASISDAKTEDQGIANITLACDTTPAGLAVPVAVNGTWVSAQAVAAWQVIISRQVQQPPVSRGTLVPCATYMLRCTTQPSDRNVLIQLKHACAHEAIGKKLQHMPLHYILPSPDCCWQLVA